MTSSFYECKVRYARNNYDDGSVRKVTENYVVVRALSFADVETIQQPILHRLQKMESTS